MAHHKGKGTLKRIQGAFTMKRIGLFRAEDRVFGGFGYAEFPLNQLSREAMPLLQLGRILSPFGAVRLFYIKPNEKYPADAQPVGVALNSRTAYVTTVYHELLSFNESAVQVRAGASLPQVPLAVVSAGHAVAPIVQARALGLTQTDRQAKVAFNHENSTVSIW